MDVKASPDVLDSAGREVQRQQVGEDPADAGEAEALRHLPHGLLLGVGLQRQRVAPGGLRGLVDSGHTRSDT